MKYYHVDSFVDFKDRCPALAQLYTTKQGAFNSCKKRFESDCYDRVLVWLEDSDKAHFSGLGGVGQVLKELRKGE